MRIKLLTCLAVAALFCFGVGQASAASHGGIYAYIATETGISIPPLVHGRMEALDANRSAIVSLAEQVAPDDAIATKLRGYVAEQRQVCLWGVMPLSLADVESPFHLCTHGFLAGTKALLMRLQDIAGEKLVVQALVDKVNADMLADGVALNICRNSDTLFNTSAIIRPEWDDVPHHFASLATFGLPLLMVFGTLLWPLRRYRARLQLRTA